MRKSICIDMLLRRRDYLVDIVDRLPPTSPNSWNLREVAALNMAIDYLTADEPVQIIDGAKTYNVGTKWAVRRNDVGEPCSYVPQRSKRKALKYLEECRAQVLEEFPDHPEYLPELVSTKVVWKVSA